MDQQSPDAFGSWDEGEITPEKLTVENIDKLVVIMKELREAEEKAKAVALDLHNKIAQCERQIVAYLTECRKTNWKVEGIGQVSIRNNFTVKNPKTPDDKKAFFDYLKERGLFEDLATVNHQTLNAFYKSERAQAEGDATFNIPGIEAPTLHQGVAFKKG
jgi:hypothetical protein